MPTGLPRHCRGRSGSLCLRQASWVRMSIRSSGASASIQPQQGGPPIPKQTCWACDTDSPRCRLRPSTTAPRNPRVQLRVCIEAPEVGAKVEEELGGGAPMSTSVRARQLRLRCRGSAVSLTRCTWGSSVLRTSSTCCTPSLSQIVWHAQLRCWGKLPKPLGRLSAHTDLHWYWSDETPEAVST